MPYSLEVVVLSTKSVAPFADTPESPQYHQWCLYSSAFLPPRTNMSMSDLDQFKATEK